MSSVEEGLRAQMRNIEARYGRTIDEWSALIRARGLGRHGEVVAMLKSDHGMTHGNANRVALTVLAETRGGLDGDPVDQLYSGPRSALRPIHDRLMGEIRRFGDDVEVAPKKAYISLRRRRQFAMIQPAAAAVDVGLILEGQTAGERLRPGTSLNAICSATASGWLLPRR